MVETGSTWLIWLGKGPPFTRLQSLTTSGMKVGVARVVSLQGPSVALGCGSPKVRDVAVGPGGFFCARASRGSGVLEAHELRKRDVGAVGAPPLINTRGKRNPINCSSSSALINITN